MMSRGAASLRPPGHVGLDLVTRRHANRWLIVVFMRGAVDGLNLVVPYNETNYYRLRPTLAIGKPDSPTAPSISTDALACIPPWRL